MRTWNAKDATAEAVHGVIAHLFAVDCDTPLSPALRARVQATIETLVPSIPFAGVPSPSAAELTGSLAVLLGLEEARAQQILHTLERVPHAPWLPSGIPGISLLPLAGGPQVAAATCHLVHGVQGHSFPRLRHQGDEWTLVLHGQLR